MAKKKTGGINKLDAVRQAMAEFGNAASRTEIHKFVKERTGVDMNLDVVSSYKGAVAREAKKAAATTPEMMTVVHAPVPATKRGPKKKPAKAAAKPLAAISPAPSSKATGIALSDIQAVKELVGRVGAKALKDLVDLFGG
jgi:hypothetical protein